MAQILIHDQSFRLLNLCLPLGTLSNKISCRSSIYICRSEDDHIQVGIKLGEGGICSLFLSSLNPNDWDVHRGLF